MKKFSCILGLLSAMLISSCSNEEFDVTDPATPDSTTNTNGSVLKKTVAIINGGTAVTTGEYYYNGDKLAKIVSPEDKYVTYTYTGDLITSREFYSNNVLSTKEVFEYNSSKQLISLKRVKANNTVIYSAVYVQNGDGTVSVTGYKGASTDPNSEIRNRKVFLQNGQVSKIETYTKVNGSTVTETATYTYDGKNTPFSGILGFDKLTYYDAALTGSTSNITSANFAKSSGGSDSDRIQYTYNTFDYPVTATETDASNSGKSTVFQYFYE